MVVATYVPGTKWFSSGLTSFHFSEVRPHGYSLYSPVWASITCPQFSLPSWISPSECNGEVVSKFWNSILKYTTTVTFHFISNLSFITTLSSKIMQLTDFMEQSPDSCLASQESLSILRSPRVHCRVPNSPPGWGIMLRVRSSPVQFPKRSLDFSIDLILPAAMWSWCRLSL
jgi:hypothetical protein